MGRGCSIPQLTRGLGKLPRSVRGKAPANHVLAHFELENSIWGQEMCYF